MTHEVISKITEQDRQMLQRCIGARLHGVSCSPLKRTSIVKTKGGFYLNAQSTRVLMGPEETPNELFGFDLHFYPSEWGIFSAYGIPVFDWIHLKGDKKIQAYYNERMRINDSVIYLSLMERRIIEKVTIHGSSAFGQRKPLIEGEFDEDEPYVNDYFRTDLDLMVSMTCQDGLVCAFGFIKDPDYVKGTIVHVYEEEAAFLEHISYAQNYYDEKFYDTHWDL